MREKFIAAQINTAFDHLKKLWQVKFNKISVKNKY